MIIDTTHLDSDSDKVRPARVAIKAMADYINNFADGYQVINVDRAPYNGNLLAAWADIPSTGKYILRLGRRDYNAFGIGTLTKPNVTIAGSGVPTYDATTQRLVSGSGTVIQGQIHNQAKGFGIFNLGIDYGEHVRTTLAGGQYNDAFINIDIGTNAGIGYGDLIILSTDVVGGNPASNTHCILNQNGSGFKQVGIVEVIGGYHGHVIKVADFIGDTTVARYQTADGMIIKTDAGAFAGNVTLNSVLIRGDNTRVSAGILLEAQAQSLSSITIGRVVANSCAYVITEAAATTHPIVDVQIGEIVAGSITGVGGGITQAVAIGSHSVGFAIGKHSLNSCVNGGISVAAGAINVDIGSGYSKSSTTGDGYKFDAPARHEQILAQENAGWGVRNNSNTSLNAEDVSCVANTLGGISQVNSVGKTLLNSWTDSAGTFRVQRHGGTISVSGQLQGGTIGAAGTWTDVVTLAVAPSVEEYLACAGFLSTGSTVPLMARVTSGGVIQVYGMGGIAVLGVSLSGRFVLHGNA